MFRRNSGEVVNGIEFTRRNRITLTNKILISPQLKALQYMLVVAGVYGTLFCLISGLDIPVYTGVLTAAFFISALYFFTLYMLPSFIKYSLPLSLLLYLAAGYIFWDEIRNGFWHLENIYITKFNAYYNTSVLKYLVEEYDEKAVLTIFFIFAGVLLSLLICGLVLRNALRFLFVIITVPVVFLPFTVGYIPSSVPFGIYLACVISIIGIGTTMKEKHRHFNLKNLHGKHKVEDRLLEQNFKYVIGLKIGGFLAALLLALIMLVCIIVTPDLYDRKFDVADTKGKLQKEMMEFNLEDAVNNISSIQFNGLDLFQGITASGGLSGGKLGRIGEVDFNYRTALRIETPVTGTSIYLKGYVGSDYKGNYWDGLSKTDLKAYEETAKLWENTDFTIGNQSSYFLALLKEIAGPNSYQDFDFSVNNMEVEEVNSNSDYVYAPYYSVYEPDTSLDVTDPEYVSPKKRQISYSLSYYDCLNDLLLFDEKTEYTGFLGSSLITLRYLGGESSERVADDLRHLEDYRTFEKAYRQFVYQIYTRLPDTGLEHVREEYGGIKYSDYKERYGTKALEMLVDMVRSNLSATTSYSLSPGTLPKGKDFVEYFLYENKTGYCTHYASAATMIFRTMGIPARYVEGYIVKPRDINEGKDMGTAAVTQRTNGNEGEYQVVNKSIDISDANAHAWVEIYLDGFGWVPVEVTPGFCGSGDIAGTAGVLPDQEEENGSSDDLEATPTPSPSEDTKQENENDPSDPKAANETASDDEKANGKSGGEADNTGSAVSGGEANSFFQTYIKKAAWVVIWSIILITAVALCILLRAFLILSKRERAQKTTDFSKRVLLRYNEIRRMLDYYSITVQEDMTCQEEAAQIEKEWKVLKPGRYRRFVDIVLKARFNQYCISEEESEEAEKFYRELVNSVYENTTFKKRFILRFIKVFH